MHELRIETYPTFILIYNNNKLMTTEIGREGLDKIKNPFLHKEM